MSSDKSSWLVLFDIGLTLLRPAPSPEFHFLDVCRQWGADPDPQRATEIIYREMDRILRRTKETTPDGLFSTEENSQAFWTTLYRDILEELGIENAQELADKLYKRFSASSTYKYYDDVLPAMAALGSAGFLIGVLSNWEGWLVEYLSENPIATHLAACVISGVVGMEKPDPRIFELALEQADMPASRVVMVGDSIEADIDPALSLGMHAVLLDRDERFDKSVTGFHRITTLDDLPRLVATIAGNDDDGSRISFAESPGSLA